MASAAVLISAGMAVAGDGFFETFDAWDDTAWHRADYRFAHPLFDTDWDADHAQVGDGLTLLLTPQEGANRFRGASVRREAPTHYGRYEAVLTAARGEGLITGFFLYTGPAYGTQHDEIDWEIFGQDTTTAQVAWWTDGLVTEHRINLGFDAADGPNRYAIEWQPGYLAWFVNGRKVFETTDNVPATPQRLFANVWAVKPASAAWAGTAPDGLYASAKADGLSFEPN
ncbi:MAG: family 16 glycosylhydrolase [Pseudomonadota bacterium]